MEHSYVNKFSSILLKSFFFAFLVSLWLFLTPFNQNSNFSVITLDQIFRDNHQMNESLSQSSKIVLIATGDIIPARSVNNQVVSNNRFLWPYEKTYDVLKNADITFVNLESPLIQGCLPTQEGMVFCGDQKNIEGLVFSGIDIASLTNNHAGNYGFPGIESTVELLQKNGILSTGTGGPVYKNIKGFKFAFLGYNNVGTPEKGLQWADPEKIRQEIGETREKADVIIVAFHWGTEYVSQPTKQQKELAHLAIDSGADLIIGNHAHWIQPIEIYKGKVITYAHGNFIFDQMWSQKTREGVVGKYTFNGNKLIDVEFLPVQIDNYGQPHFVGGIQKSKILDEMKSESFILSGE